MTWTPTDSCSPLAMSSRTLRSLLLTLALALAAAPGQAATTGKVYLTKQEALELAFKDCEVVRSTLVLEDEQQRKVARLSGSPFERNLVFKYVATRKGKLVGTAYFDVHRVRTLRETLMFVVDPEGRIARLEVLAFGEPVEYMPRSNWYAQFKGKSLDETLSLKKGIKRVTGATLTTRATTSAARRVLALHKVCAAEPEKPKPERAKPTEKPKPTGKGEAKGEPR